MLLHRGAERELTTAFRFYQVEASPGIARRFLDEFERVANLLVEYPEIGTPAGQDRRSFPLRGFPYLMLYRSTAAGPRILVVRHQSRDPSLGDERG